MLIEQILRWTFTAHLLRGAKQIESDCLRLSEFQLQKRHRMSWKLNSSTAPAAVQLYNNPCFIIVLVKDLEDHGHAGRDCHTTTGRVQTIAKGTCSTEMGITFFCVCVGAELSWVRTQHSSLQAVPTSCHDIYSVTLQARQGLSHCFINLWTSTEPGTH